MEPPAALAHASDAPSSADRSGGGAVGEFFAALGDSWRLTGAHRARLTPAVKDALRMGWTPAALAAFTGANTDGVRNPYAVLATQALPRRAAPAGRSAVGPATVVRYM